MLISVFYLTPLGDKSRALKLNLDSTGRVSDLWFLRSKSVILFPTGDMTVFPSGVKIRSPPRYTVPNKFENLYENFILISSEGTKHDQILIYNVIFVRV